jgi:hypothetical protein
LSQEPEDFAPWDAKLPTTMEEINQLGNRMILLTRLESYIVSFHIRLLRLEGKTAEADALHAIRFGAADK